MNWLVDGSECEMQRGRGDGVNDQTEIAGRGCLEGWTVSMGRRCRALGRYSQTIAARGAGRREMMEMRDEEREVYERDESRRASSPVCVLTSSEARR